VTDHVVPNEIASLIERLEGEEALDFEVKAARSGLPTDATRTLGVLCNMGLIHMTVTGRGTRCHIDPGAKAFHLKQSAKDCEGFSTIDLDVSTIGSEDSSTTYFDESTIDSDFYTSGHGGISVTPWIFTGVEV
jgi:hypothetical protein